MIKKPLIVYKTVAGNHTRDNVNQRQIDVIKNEIIPNENLCTIDDSLGIVTPYRNQTNALQSQFKGTGVKADTVDKFQGQENDIMRSIMSAMFPSVLFSFSSQLDQRILSGSRLFNSSFSDPALAATTYAYLEVPWGDRTLYIVDIGVSYGLMNKLELNSVTGYLVMLYRYVLRPLFASRYESSAHNFRGMFGWCRLERSFKGSTISCPTIWNKRPAIWQRISRA